MKRSSLQVLTLPLALLCVCSLSGTAYSERTYSVAEMQGTISVLSKKNKILSVGDTLKVTIDSDHVVQGDKLIVFEPLTRRKRKGKSENETNRPLIHVGELIVTGIREGSVYGEITSANREIVSGSFVRPAYPNQAGSPEIIGFLQKIASARLKNPVEDILHIGITDTVNESGDVTRATAEISKEIREVVCGRAAFNCTHPKQIKTTLSKYGVRTSASIGKYIRETLNREAGVDILITSKVETQKNRGTTTLVAWDLKREMKSKPYIIANSSHSGAKPVYQGEILEKANGLRHGILKIRLNNSQFTGLRRVDYLQTVNIEEIVYKRFISDLSGRFQESVAWKDIYLILDGERYLNEREGWVYDSVLPAKTYRLRIFATPVLAGDPSVLLGKPIEESFELEIPPDTTIHTEIILKTRGKKAILIVDSVPEF